MAAARDRLLERRMQRWASETRRKRAISPAMEAQWQEQAKAEEAKQSATLATMPETDLRLLLRAEDVIEQREQNQERQAARFRGPSPGM